MLKQLDALIASVRDEAQSQRHAWPKVRDDFEPSAANLAGWLALRRRDLRPLQRSLMALGLSSLGRLEGRVFEALAAVRASLAAVAHAEIGERPSADESFAGQERLRARTEQLFGPAHATRPVAVMVTCPSEAADDADFFPQLARRGVEAIRINCAHDKIEQFETELSTRSTPDAEKLLALEFLMHFVGDVHQPLHASDNLDRGGNNEAATAFGDTAALHSHWDTTFVEHIGVTGTATNLDPQSVANALRKPTAIEAAHWLGRPDPRSWALQSYALAQNYAYAPLPAPTVTNGKAVYVLSAQYTKDAIAVTADQLLRAGYRLAAVLNAALDR